MAWRYRVITSLGLVSPALILIYTAGQGSSLALVLTGWSGLILVNGIWWLVNPASSRLAQATAWLGFMGLLLAPLSLLQVSLWQGLLALLLAVIALLLSGFASVWRGQLPAEVERPHSSLALAIKVMFDELVMGYFLSTLKFPRGAHRQRVIQECREALNVMRQRGWLAQPVQAHPEPHVPDDISLSISSHKQHRYTRLEFSSGFPGLDLPGSERWLGRQQTVHARLFEHSGQQRPWLMCIHGYRMGWLPLDFQLFPPGWLHYKLGFNLIMPILPLHGARRHGWRSGDGLFDGDVMDMLHAVMQGVHDLRSLLVWLRSARNAESIAVLGYSLGGLHAALLSCLEPTLRHVSAGIPLADVPTVMWNNSPRGMIGDYQQQGLTFADTRALLGPISPLAMPTVMSPERLDIVAAKADRLVPALPVADLSRHWQQRRPLWYDGSHLSVRQEAVVRDWLQQQWQQAGLLA